MFFEKPSCLLNLIGGIIVLEKIKGQHAGLPLVMMIHPFGVGRISWPLKSGAG
jgi:hypothetical protein